MNPEISHRFAAPELCCRIRRNKTSNASTSESPSDRPQTHKPTCPRSIYANTHPAYLCCSRTLFPKVQNDSWKDIDLIFTWHIPSSTMSGPETTSFPRDRCKRACPLKPITHCCYSSFCHELPVVVGSPITEIEHSHPHELSIRTRRRSHNTPHSPPSRR